MHDHPPGHEGDHVHPHQDNEPPGVGHNRNQRRPAQWQTPHLPHGPAGRSGDAGAELDVDLVEAAFSEGFARTPDPTSFVRLASIPFEGQAADGRLLYLLRVEQEAVTDLGTASPLLGGSSFRYDPLPAKLVQQRHRLRFIYTDFKELVPLTFAEARALRPS